MICAICLEEPHDPRQIPACGHTYCYTCLKKIRDMNYHQCPTCRGYVSGALPVKHRVDATIDFISYKRAGLLVENAREGVKILQVNQADGAYAAGLRKGQVIEQMNGIPTTCPLGAMRLLDAAKQELVCVHVKRKKCNILSRFFKKKRDGVYYL